MRQPEDSTAGPDPFFAELLKAEGGKFEAFDPAGPGDGQAPDLMPLLAPLLKIETEALAIAREEMRKDGLLPSVPAGMKITLELAIQVSRYLRGRLGLSLDPEVP